MKPELFMIDAKAVGALTVDDVGCTFQAMREVGIAYPPMDHFVIAFDLSIFSSSFLKWKETDQDKKRLAELRASNEENKNIALGVEVLFSKESGHFRSNRFHINKKTLKLVSDPVETEESEQSVFRLIFQTLVVLLATQNSQKDRVENSPRASSAKQRNASKHFAYTTTIRIGKITENCSSGGTGSPMRPHLRRGHVRNQRYGEGRREIKQIFIAPVFINADKEYVESQRIAYKIRA